MPRGEVRRLPSFENAADDIGGQELKPRDAGEMGSLHFLHRAPPLDQQRMGFMGFGDETEQLGIVTGGCIAVARWKAQSEFLSSA